MGGYSKGCFDCRRRKIKCDEGQPICMHCARRGSICQYRDPHQFAFRSMNGTLAARYDRRSAPMLMRPSINWEQQAQMHFFHHYVIQSGTDRRGYLEFLPSLLDQNQGHSALKHAFAAASMAQFANAYGLTELSSKAQARYGLALRDIARAMEDPSSASTDCGLASIVLLQKYEVICGVNTGRFDAHDAGLANLISVRRRQGRSLDDNHGLSFVINGRRQMSAIDGTTVITDRNSTMSGISLAGAQLWRVLGSIGHVCNRMRQPYASHDTVSSTPSVLDTWGEATTVYLQLQTWQQRVPAQLRYNRIEAEITTPGRSPYPIAQYTFSHLLHGVMWIGVWTSQIRLLVAMLAFGGRFDLFSWPSITPERVSQADLRSALQDTVNAICACSLYMMGKIDGNGNEQPSAEGLTIGSFFLIRGFAVASELGELTHDQTELILDRLWQIGNRNGIKQALNVRERMLFQYTPEASVTWQ